MSLCEGDLSRRSELVKWLDKPASRAAQIYNPGFCVVLRIDREREIAVGTCPFQEAILVDRKSDPHTAFHFAHTITDPFGHFR